MENKTVFKSYRRKIQGIELFAQIDRAMKDPALFSNPGLTRKSAADRLDSNEQYIREAILDYTGLTFSAYIIRVRLEYACELLLSEQPIYTIKEVSDRCGFGGVSTFYRQFKNHNEMTPEEYRNIHG